MKPNRYKAFLAVLILSIIWGINTPLIKFSLKVIPPFTFAFIRFFLAFILILPIFLRSKPKFKKQDLQLVWLSLLATFSIILFVLGIRFTLASVGQVIYSFQPIVVAIISYFLLKEKIGIKKIFGIIIGFIGVYLVIYLPFSYVSKSALLGNLMIFIACLSYSYYVVLSKKFSQKYSPLWLTIAFIFTTIIVSLFLSFSELRLISVWSGNISASIIWAIIYTVIMGTILAFFFQQYVIKIGSPLIASLNQYITPAVTMVFSSMILGEKFSLFLIFGTVVTLFGAWMVTRES
ncbi:MAG: DMT family transporter [Candidatus Roizmanbacteria bacterium]|nr:DMT family transporter [Candidatus Roizmanbacteria bacterium]